MTPYDHAAVSFAQTHLAPLAAQLDRRRLRKGQIIIVRGEVLLHAFMLTRGRAVASYATAKGEASFELAPGEFFGEDALFEDAVSRAEVRAEAEDTIVAAIPAAEFKALLDVNALLRQTVAVQWSRRPDGAGGGRSPWGSSCLN